MNADAIPLPLSIYQPHAALEAWDKGYHEAREEGFRVGFNRGEQAGRVIGIHVGEEKGYQDGQEEGYQIGVIRGFVFGSIIGSFLSIGAFYLKSNGGWSSPFEALKGFTR